MLPSRHRNSKICCRAKHDKRCYHNLVRMIHPDSNPRETALTTLLFRTAQSYLNGVTSLQETLNLLQSDLDSWEI